jgi:hypothetical protein
MRRSAFARGGLLAVAIVLLQVLLVPLFAGPAAHLGPRDLPLAVAGPPSVAAALPPGAFDVTLVPDAATADARIRDRSVYGAVIVGPAGPSLHVASAASPTVAALLQQAATELGGGRPVPVVDVVPTDRDDPRGAGFAAGFLPMAMTGLLAGILTYLLVRRRAARILTLAGFAVLAGFAGAAVQQDWLGVLPGDYLGGASVLALFALAVASAVTGLGAVLDRAGLGLGAATIFLVGNALSGVSSAPELLPQPWGTFGQFLPVGAGATLLRSVVYFDGHGAARAVGVLAAYAVGGLALVAVGRRGLRRDAPRPAVPATTSAVALAG